MPRAPSRRAEDSRLPRGGFLTAFLGSCVFLLGIIGASAASYFPVMLRATGADVLSITAYTGGGDEASLSTFFAGRRCGLRARSSSVPRDLPLRLRAARGRCCSLA